jgi:hypothetical protein
MMSFDRMNSKKIDVVPGTKGHDGIFTKNGGTIYGSDASATLKKPGRQRGRLGISRRKTQGVCYE